MDFSKLINKDKKRLFLKNKKIKSERFFNKVKKYFEAIKI